MLPMLKRFVSKSLQSTINFRRLAPSALQLVSPRQLSNQLSNRLNKAGFVASVVPALALFSLVSLSGCSSSPTKTVTGEVGHSEGQWRGRALLRNLKTTKSNTLTIDILAREPSQLRMEISAAFGVRVASLAMNGNDVFVELTQQKRFLTTSATSGGLSRVIPVRIPPKALMAVLFDRPLPKSEWNCDSYIMTKLPVECEHRTDGVTVKWLERKALTRRIKITTTESEIEMVIDEAKSKVQFNDDAFKLEAPEGFKLETTN